jgi:hypothetical protein
MTDHIENLERRCPRLGGSVISVSYCMISGNDNLPCFKMLDCWWETFDVESYLREHLTGSLFQEFIESAQAPQNKITSILEIANMARRKTDQKE